MAVRSRTVVRHGAGLLYCKDSPDWRLHDESANRMTQNLCVGELFAPVYFFCLPKRDPRPGVSFIARMREIDWVGSVLQVGAFASGIMAISFGGVIFA